MIKKTCKYEGCESTKIWSRGFCRQHTFYKPLEKSNKPIKKISENGKIKKEEKKEYTKKQFELFRKFYDEHPIKKCEQCGINIYKCLSINVHHLLPKAIEKYKKVALESKYWMLLCGNCHSAWENSSVGDKIKIRTDLAKEEFNQDL